MPDCAETERLFQAWGIGRVQQAGKGSLLHWGSHQKGEEGETNQKKKRGIAAFAAGIGGIGAGNRRIEEKD